MKKLSILVLVILSISYVTAFSFDDLFNLELNSFITGKSVDNRDPSVTLSRPVNTQVVNNPVVFKWRYFDAEDDKMEFYILQIDDDRRFFSPQNFQGVGVDHKLTLEEGLYYWRVKVVNKYGESLSKVWEFYVDPKVKVCEDGTPYFECSSNEPFYCAAGMLRQECQRCGCDGSASCQPDGVCFEFKCTDGTPYGECSLNKPLYCQNGKIREVCNLCGCENGLECNGDGSCEVVVNEEPFLLPMENTDVAPRLTFLERVARFFRSILFGR